MLPKSPVADEGALPVGTPMASTSIAQFLALNPRLMGLLFIFLLAKVAVVVARVRGS